MPRSSGERAPLPGSRAGSGEGPVDIARLSTAELVGRIAQDAQRLVKLEVQLGKAELRADLHQGVATVKRLALAVGLAIVAALMVVVTLVLALAIVLPAWAAALIVTGLLSSAAGLAASHALRDRPLPLARTRQHVQTDLRWARSGPLGRAAPHAEP